MSRFRNAINRLDPANLKDGERRDFDLAFALDAQIGAIEPYILKGGRQSVGFEKYISLNDNLDVVMTRLAANPRLLKYMNGIDLDVLDMLKRPVGRP